MNAVTPQTLCHILTAVFGVLTILAGLGARHYGNMEQKLKDEKTEARQEFLVERDKPLKGGSVILVLKEKLSPNDLGHFRFMVQILNLLEPDPHPSLWIAGRDAYVVRVRNGMSYKLMGTKLEFRGGHAASSQ